MVLVVQNLLENATKLGLSQGREAFILALTGSSMHPRYYQCPAIPCWACEAASDGVQGASPLRFPEGDGRGDGLETSFEKSNNHVQHGDLNSVKRSI